MKNVYFLLIVILLSCEVVSQQTRLSILDIIEAFHDNNPDC
ncbi:MAG TPA: hypothetical protein VFM70_03005 [Salinimicrobium sp.]|nr:hypothetical protein [Salinimicrobium sp.]